MFVTPFRGFDELNKMHQSDFSVQKVASKNYH